MKILIVGSSSPWAIENYYHKHLLKHGFEVSIFDCSHYYQLYSLFKKILNRLHVGAIYSRVNSELLETCKEAKPDIVWIFKGVEIFASTLISLKKAGAKLFNYNPDHPFLRTSVSHGGKNMEKMIGLYDAHFSYSEDLKAFIEKEFHLPVFLLPFAYEPSSLHEKDPARGKDFPRICMIGNADRIRADVIKNILKEGMEVDVYGNYWKRFLPMTTSCRIFPPVYGDYFWNTMLDYRIQLNIFRPHNEGSHNMRTFEIPSIGGIQLAPFSKEHAKFFTNNKEIWMYRDQRELKEKALHLLQMNGNEIIEYRRAAKSRCQEEEYTYENRARDVGKAMEIVTSGMKTNA